MSALASIALCVVAAWLAMGVGVLLGKWFANLQWMQKASLRYGRMSCGGRLFWVVDASDAVDCRALIELLTEEEHQRESADAADRLRGKP